jgi:hypothetical protein
MLVHLTHNIFGSGIQSLEGQWMILSMKRTKKTQEKCAALRNGQKPHAAHAAFVQPLYFLVPDLSKYIGRKHTQNI